MRWAALWTSVVAVALALAAAPAHASPRQISLMQDDDLLLRQPAAEVDRTLARMASLGVDAVRISAIWRDIAPRRKPDDPSDPADYPAARLDPLDTAIEAATRHGIGVLLNLRGGVPRWARRGTPVAAVRRKDAWRPDPAQFGAFAFMLGTRYSGVYTDSDDDHAVLPRVSAWSTWNEPNWGGLLQPQSLYNRHTGHWHTVSPSLYRDLHRAAVRGLAASGHPTDTILLGETAPRGATAKGPGIELAPARFLRDLLCLNTRLKPLTGAAARVQHCDFGRRGPLYATGYAHHPYPIMDPPEAPSPYVDDLRLADTPQLERILDAAARYHRLPGRLPIWFTEFGYQTLPPDPFRGIRPALQAQWLIRAERLTYLDRRVISQAQFELRDALPNPHYDLASKGYWSTYQMGLEFSGGTPKPAETAYELPLLALDRRTLWGLVRPAPNGVPQTITIQRQGAWFWQWHKVETVAVTDPMGYFTVHVPPAKAGTYRFVWDGRASLPAQAVPKAVRYPPPRPR